MVQSERSSFPAAYVEQAMRELHAERAKTAAATEELVQSLKKDQEVRRRERMAMAANDPMPPNRAHLHLITDVRVIRRHQLDGARPKNMSRGPRRGQWY